MKTRLNPVCALLFACWPIASPAAEPAPGAPAKTSITKKEVVDAADFAIKAQQKALSDATAKTGKKLELVKILGAEEQVVAGMNYHLTLKVKLDGKERDAEAKVWWQAWRKPDPYQLTSWTWIEEKKPGHPPDK